MPASKLMVGKEDWDLHNWLELFLVLSWSWGSSHKHVFSEYQNEMKFSSQRRRGSAAVFLKYICVTLKNL